jgi:hypothetical protein
MGFEQIESNVFGCLTPITLPGSQGATGATGTTGTAGAALLYNNHTPENDASSTDPYTYPTLTYSMVNIPTPVMGSTGDMIEIETYFSVDIGVSCTFKIMFGASTACSYVIHNSLGRNNIMILKTRITRTGANTQSVECEYSVDGTYGIAAKKTTTENLAANLSIYPSTTKIDAGSAGNITCEFFRITKYKI